MLTPSGCAAGYKFNFQTTVCNIGSATTAIPTIAGPSSGYSRVVVYASKDSTLTSRHGPSFRATPGHDVELGAIDVPELVPGACYTGHALKEIALAGGAYSLGAIADDYRSISEENEANNSLLGPSFQSTLAPDVCGDGVVTSGETCDDANTVDGDGCSSSCFAEDCNDGVVNRTGEQCDDGNATSGDGCSATCTVEACGNGILDVGEQCDDGNTTNGDGCSSTCRTERCGDGVVNGAGETCDDGNTVNGDGCDSSCKLETCGDGLVNNAGAEACDDGNTISGDGCSAACQYETPVAVFPWSANATGTQTVNMVYNSAMGYHFTPVVTGTVSQLGALVKGTKVVKLFDRTTGAVLAQTTVTANNNWAFSNITPVTVNANQQYTVAVYVAGSSGSYRSGVTLPRVYGNVRIDGGTNVSTATDPNARPTNLSTSTMWGQADIKFTPNYSWYAPAQPWQQNQNGTSSTYNGGEYARGYHFTPLTNGRIVGLGGNYSGTRTVRLFDRTSGTLLATATNTSSLSYSYSSVNVPVTAGSSYTVAVYLPGGSYTTKNSATTSFPQAFGALRLDGATYLATSDAAGLRPTNLLTSTVVAGQVDIRFVASP